MLNFRCLRLWFAPPPFLLPCQAVPWGGMPQLLGLVLTAVSARVCVPRPSTSSSQQAHTGFWKVSECAWRVQQCSDLLAMAFCSLQLCYQRSIKPLASQSANAALCRQRLLLPWGCLYHQGAASAGAMPDLHDDPWTEECIHQSLWCVFKWT